MSDNWIILIPEDPKFVPSESRRSKAKELFSTIAPDADEVELKVSDAVVFFDCGANYERVLCPSCSLEIPLEWWQDRMTHDFDSDNGFMLATYPTPCCRNEFTLHELNYEWPQGFGRFAVEAMNPNIGKLDDKNKAEFEAVLDTRLRVIYQHI